MVQNLTQPLTQSSSRSHLAQWLTVPTLLGLALLLMGLMVMSGWLLQSRAMVEIRPGLVAMVFNTALCFSLAGLALFWSGPGSRRLQTVVGVFLLCWPALVLVEYVQDYDLGIDWGFLHTWLHDGNTRPGRLAPNTAIGFILTGLSLILLNRIHSRRRELLFQILVFSLLAIGLTGLIGYVLSPDQLFGWARSARMAIHTAVGMNLLAVALWISRYRMAHQYHESYLDLDEKIGFISAAILCVMTLAAGLTGFVFQQSLLEDSLRDKLQFRLNGQLNLLQSGLEKTMVNAQRAGTDERLLAPAWQLATQAQAGDQVFLPEMNGLLHHGFRSVSLRSVEGKVLREVGVPASPASTILPLARKSDQLDSLLWNGELRLQSEVPLRREGKVFAHLILSQHLPVLQAQLFDLRGLGETGEMALCQGQGADIVCLPSGRQALPYRVGRTNLAGQPLPMTYALAGKTGLVATLDYKGHNVMAAHAPVSANLGLVVKQDTTELYGVIRTQLKFVLPALLVLVLLGTLLMYSQIKPLTRRLSASETHAREQQLEINTVVNSVGEGIMTINEAGVIESFNLAAAAIFGYAADEVIGQSLQILMPASLRAAHQSSMQHYLSTGEGKVVGRPKLEMPGLRKDGSEFTLELTVNEIRFEARRVFVGVVRDITERKQFEEKLIFLAQYDVLTGLPNRALFMDRLSGALLRASRSRSALAVMFLDLDGFKRINDTMGHHSGDALLRQFGSRLCMAVRKSDSVARLAGDEFTIILEGLNNPEQDTRDVAEKIIGLMQEHFDLGEHKIKVTTSIGLAIHAEGEVELDELLRRADDAMYRAKQSGKNRWCL